MAFLDDLTHDDHAALCALPPPHGPLFNWLEAQFHEHGPQPWAVLRESLREHECEELAVKVMTGAHAQAEGEEHELRAELTDSLARIQIEQLEQQRNIASMQGELERLRELDARWRSLKSSLAIR